jgi:hypothetical protein
MPKFLDDLGVHVLKWYSAFFKIEDRGFKTVDESILKALIVF